MRIAGAIFAICFVFSISIFMLSLKGDIKRVKSSADKNYKSHALNLQRIRNLEADVHVLEKTTKMTQGETPQCQVMRMENLLRRAKALVGQDIILRMVESHRREVVESEKHIEDLEKCIRKIESKATGN